MNKVFQLYYHGFDSLENRDPYYKESLGIFSTLKKAKEELKKQSEKHEKYKGYDGETYPKFKIVERKLK